MKKFLFITIITLILTLVNNIQIVSAATLTSTDIEENKSYVFVWENEDNRDTGYLKNFDITDDNGITKVAYCIEPYIAETTEPNGYTEATWETIGLSNDIKQEILLTAYYGYQYPNHQTQEYRAATQALLWKTILNSKYGTGYEVSYYKSYYNEQDEHIRENWDLSNEMKVITDLIAQHYITPSFSGKTFSSQVNIPITITDENNVLKNYEIYASNDAIISINENNLTLTPTKPGTIELKFVKKTIYNEPYFLYYSEDYQNMITGGEIDPIYFSINLTGTTSLNVVKMDSETTEIALVPDTGLSNINYYLLSIIAISLLGLIIIIYGIKENKKTPM